MSEVAIAAGAILSIEKEAARAREWAGTHGDGRQGSRAAGATAQRWGKGRDWIEWLLDVTEAAQVDPQYFKPLAEYMDRVGSPKRAWLWLRENRDRPVGEAPPLPPETSRRELVTPAETWRLSDVAVAARALLAAGYPPEGSEDGSIVSIDHLNLPRKALTHVAALWGESADWLQKIFDVCAAAEAEPEVFGRLVGVMDKAGTPTAARRRLKNLHDERRVLRLRPLLARFTTLVIDPPWNEDNLSQAAGHEYAQMSLDAIRALPVTAWAEEDAHLYLWYTNNTMPLACELVKSWGFQYKSHHTWVKETEDEKPKIGLGREFRNSTEGFIFARRGSRDVLMRREATFSIPTHHRWPVGANSEKPEGFYDLVRASSYPRYGEAFQRLVRPDFQDLFESIDVPIAAAAE